MPIGTTDYKGLTVLDSAPTGGGGELIQDNFKELADRWGAQSLYGGDDEPVCGYTTDHQAACDDETEGRWTVTGTLAFKTDYFFKSTTATPAAASVSLGTGISKLKYTPAATIDCAGKYLIIRIYQYHAHVALPATWGYYYLNLYSEAHAKVSTTYTFAKAITTLTDLGPGWREYIVPCDDIGLGAGETIMADRTAVSRIQICCAGNAGDATEFAVHRLDVVTAAAIPGSYAIRIDNITDADMPPIAAYAASVGVKLTIGVSAANFDRTGGYMTSAAAAKLADYGHEIVVYGGHSEGTAWAAWTAAEKLAYVSLWHRQMAAAGIAWNGVLFVPGGEGIGWPYDRENLIRPGLLSSISGAYYTAADNVLTLPGFRMNSWTGFINVCDGDLPDYLEAKIAECEANGGLLILGSHVVTANDKAALKLSIDALEASTLVNKTFGENVGL